MKIATDCRNNKKEPKNSSAQFCAFLNTLTMHGACLYAYYIKSIDTKPYLNPYVLTYTNTLARSVYAARSLSIFRASVLSPSTSILFSKAEAFE